MPIEIGGLCPLLQVFDMSASVHFYRDILGFELITTSQPGDVFDWALLRRNRVEVMLNTAYEAESRPAARAAARAAAHADTALYFGCSDLDGAYRHLRAQGLPVDEPVTRPYGMRQLSVNDPDGYHLCFQWPADERTQEQWRQWYGMEPARV